MAVQNGVSENVQGKNKKKTKRKQVSCSSVMAKSSTGCSKNTKGSTSKTASQKDKNLIDIDNLSPEDISKL